MPGREVYTISFLLLFISANQLYAQNQPPVVENVSFTQRTDGTFVVDVYYDVNDPEGESMTVTMETSDDNGTTWGFTCNNLTGDVGAGIISGTNKHIVWDFGSEHPQTFGDQFRIKIIADDGGGTGGGEPCPGIPTVTYEGKTYNTVLIGSQCWLKENLDVGTMIPGTQNATNNGVIEKYCYDDDSANCNIYGGLYQWEEAMQYVTTESTQGICPSGWHIPSLAEFQTLAATVNNDGNALKAIGQGTGGGSGTNTSGFSALLAGYRYSNGSSSNLGYNANFWSSTEEIAALAIGLRLYYDNSNINIHNPNKSWGFSIRCLKD